VISSVPDPAATKTSVLSAMVADWLTPTLQVFSAALWQYSTSGVVGTMGTAHFCFVGRHRFPSLSLQSMSHVDANTQ